VSQATKQHTTPTRRSALGFSAAAIVAGLTTPAVASTQPDADAELIAACAEAVQCEARFRHIDEHGTTEEDCADAGDAWDNAFLRVTGMHAMTAAGIRAKAYVLKLAIVRENAISSAGDEPIDSLPISGVDVGLGMSLVRDILALGGVS
jgi:hypothetical protein